MKTNTQRLLASAILGLFAYNTAIAAPVTVIDFGESTAYVTSNQNLGGNGAASFSTSVISPSSPDYVGTALWGGARYGASSGMDTWAIMDDWTSTGFDSIRGRVGSATAGTPGTYVAMFSATQNFTIDNAESSFFLKGRRDGGQTVAGVTGVRWLLQDTSNNYYVSALNDSANAQFGNAYASNPGVTGSSLVDLAWFDYTFTTGVIGSAIADEATFFSSTEFKSAGFNYVAQRTGNGAIDMSFADFNVVAIPEPSSLVLLGIAGLCVGLFLRRRR
jgi:hypothetical protein